MDQINLFKEYEKFFKSAAEAELKEKPEKFYAFSPFALQDAIGERNVKKVWIEYNRLIFQGIEPEELIHKIISKIRDLLAISLGANKESLGLKDYPYSKSKRDLKNWQVEDLKRNYTNLVRVYHESRMVGGEKLDTALEKALLRL